MELANFFEGTTEWKGLLQGESDLLVSVAKEYELERQGISPIQEDH